MSMPNSVSELLQQQGVEFQLVPHETTRSLEQAARSTGIPTSRIAKGIMLGAGEQTFLGIVPLSHVLDFSLLRDALGDIVEPVPMHPALHGLDDCEAGCVPPLGQAFQCQVVVDESLQAFDTVYFEPGSHDGLVRVSGEAFAGLQGDSVQWLAIARPADELMAEGFDMNAPEINIPPELAMGVDVSTLTPAPEARRRIEQIYDLPPMPQMAQELLQLQGDPDASIQDLARIVELDPSLAAQVVRYARSPFFGFRGKIDTIHEAITRVLGFDMVMNMALGIAAGQSFRNPPDGPLGLTAFWKHATYSAALAQALVRRIPQDIRPKTGVAYLSGLLHNFGFLLLGHLFQPEFFLLNKLVSTNPHLPVTMMEQHVLGMGGGKEALVMGHTEMGAWLMQTWNMPEEIIVTVREHHNADYRDDHWVYPCLMRVVDCLLRQRHIGDGDTDILPQDALQALKLDQAEVQEIADGIFADCGELDAMARQMAA